MTSASPIVTNPTCSAKSWPGSHFETTSDPMISPYTAMLPVQANQYPHVATGPTNAL
jgi:hypothetical protein